MGIGDVAAPEAGEVLVPDHLDAMLAQPAGHCLDVLDEDARMSLASRSEVVLDAQVQLEGPTAEPRTPARSEHRRLRNLRHAERVAVEAAQGSLRPAGGSDLHMVQTHQPARHEVGAIEATTKMRRKGSTVPKERRG